ncbi:CPBP family intramembrane glutamic endopeptidase [Persephonella hydrogeniphila]|uniref:CPBP family intramembrane glutamic endopeptidase n=1 Tax=Persephonella hydrogeniphila TaxID=198703 RepID=UPI001C5F00B4|nr:CPBP family intramembrane glutamic endopeptidase [Persephonella hydrogeniphila]
MYSLLCIFLFLGKEHFIFYYLSSIVLLIPVLFYNLESFGFLKFKGFIYGIVSSLLFLPFITLSVSDLRFFPQAFSEEIFFRGYIQNELSKKSGIHLSIFITSFLFTIPHFILNPSVLSVMVFFPSVVFGYLYYYSNSVWASSIFHFFSNLFFWQYLRPILS